MSVYTVQKIKQVQAGGEGEKAWTKHKVRIDTADGFQDVLLFCNKWAPVPAEGSTIEGEVGKPFKAGQLPEFERARKSGGGGGSRDFKADPEKLEIERARNRSIAMQNAHGHAVQLLQVAIERGWYEPHGADPLSEMTRLVQVHGESLYGQIQAAAGPTK